MYAMRTLLAYTLNIRHFEKCLFGLHLLVVDKNESN